MSRKHLALGMTLSPDHRPETLRSLDLASLLLLAISDDAHDPVRGILDQVAADASEASCHVVNDAVGDGNLASRTLMSIERRVLVAIALLDRQRQARDAEQTAPTAQTGRAA